MRWLTYSLGVQANVRWWFRNLAIGGVVGLGVGLVVGGTLGRVFMRLLTLAQEDSRGFETAMGAIIGDFTAGGTGFIYVVGALFGLAVGLAYIVVRTLLPPSRRWRTLLFTLGVSGVLLGQILRSNRDDFRLVPVTLSVALVLGSVAITALPVPLLVDRFAPDRERDRGRAAHAAVGLGLAGIAVYAAMGIAAAYAV